MGYDFSDHDVEKLLLQVSGDPRKEKALGRFLALEKLGYLLDETRVFHRIYDSTHRTEEKFLRHHRDVAKQDFQDAVSDQNWTNITVMLVETLATAGMGGLLKAGQAANLTSKMFKAFDLLANINSIYGTYADLHAGAVSPQMKNHLADPSNKLQLQKSMKAISDEAVEAFRKEMEGWNVPLQSGVAMYLYWHQTCGGEPLAYVDSARTLRFLKQYAVKILADAKIWNQIRANTPQPNGWQWLFGSGAYNTEIEGHGYDFALYEVTLTLLWIHGHPDCRTGQITTRLRDIDQRYNTAWKVIGA